MGITVNLGVKRGLGAAQLVPLALSLFLVRYAQGQGPGVALSGIQMKSREADTRIQFEIEEGKPAGTLVGTIPIKPNFVYRFNDQPKEFALNGTTGEIRTAVEIDRESLRSDRFDLVVLSSQPTYPIEVRVVIVDVNDNAPVFPEPSLNITFSESANVGTRVILDTATDGDAGVNDITTDYKIVSGNEESKFRLVVTTNPSGETPYLHLETTGKVDREGRSRYQLNISGQDGGVPPQYGYLQLNITILDVNDNPPIFDHSDYSVSLNESVPPGTSVLQVRATDNDDGDNAKISYFLSDTEIQFAVDPRTGVISTLEPLSCQQNCPTLDKCPKSCVFTVFARDHGSPRQDGRAYVTVNLVDANDHDPKIRFRFFPTTATHATVDENAQNGSVVAAVSVIDYDEGDNGDTYVEIQGGNELNHFRLETTRSFDIVRVNGILDREQISKYNLTITAKDKGSPPRSSTSFLIIHVNDVNDHEPVFEKNEYSAILSELVPSGTYVAGITATDEDTGINSNIYYSIVSGNDRRWFNIDLYTGLVTTVAALDRETQDFVELKITARDGGPNPKYTYTYLKIQILDENDEPPLFSQVYINVSLSENAPQNSLVSVVSAVDNDLGTNGSLLYSLHEEVEIRYPNTFHLDPTYGRLTTKTRLDREIIPVYYIKVVARDQGQVPLTSTATVQLNVLDVNDNAPVFYPKQYLAKVDPDSKPGTEVVKVSATDMDEGRHAVVSYYIVSGADGKFEIDESTGVIRTRIILNRSLKSRYELVVAASNPGDREVSQNAMVLVFVVDSKQNQIEFGESKGYAFVVEEDPANRDPNVGREVGRVSLTRASSSTGVKYTIADGDSLGWYKIDERSGVITTAKAVDREMEPKSVLKVVAYGPSHFAITRVNITIRDINDCAPQFSSLRERAEIYENWPVGHEVFLSRALDKDEGINSLVEYSLSEDTSPSFRIDRKKGIIYLSKPLKLVAGEEYNVEVIAKDSGTPPLSSRQVVIVSVQDVNDHTPIFDHLTYETSLLESTSLNERFFSVLATDADTGPNGKISYKITEGNEDQKFGIFPDGFIYVKNALDRETRDYYSLTIVAKDNGTKPRMSDVAVVIHVVDENDNSPQFENKTFTFYIAENEAPDTYVGKLTADDQDKGRNAELTYSISTNQNDFVVDPKTGLIRTLKDFDREKLMEISGHDYIVMEAIVLDGGLTRLRDEAKVIVYVTDVNDNSPVFVRTPYRTTISEGAPLRSQVLRVTATDADDGLNGNVLYKITGGNEEGCFEIDDSSGQITLAKTLDRERTQTYELMIQARDTGEISSPAIPRHTSTASVTINVLDENDNNPKFVVAKQEAEIVENTPVGYRIFNFSATDADMGSNGDVSYTIAAGNIKETFRIDPITGVLHLVRPLDYEEQSIFYLNVTAHDGGAPRLTSTIPFTVRVVDVNDNPPLFPNVAIVRQIEEGIPVNTPVVTVTAEDKDSGVNGKVIYRISQQEPPGQHFDIKKDTGVIFTSNKIDREFSDSYKLTVVAEDQASPESSRLSADKTVTIIVEDINDNAPTFVSMDTGVIPEGSERARVIMTLLATDNDANTNGMVTYELVEGHGDLFFLDRTSGELYLSRAVEKPAVIYHLTIQATDEAVLSQRKSSRNKITVIGASKKSDGPIFSATEYSGSVFENEAAGTSVLTVRASYTTGDSDSRSVVEYFLTSVQSNGEPQQRVFAINRQSGVISTAAILDREAGARVYELEVYAVDIGSSVPKTSKCKATITILDRNDSPPVFSSTLSKFSLSEDAPPGHTVAIVTADDPDIEGRVSYTLVPNGQEKKFALDAENGVLTLHEPLDREMQAQHRIIIKADDEIQSSQTTLLVEVTDTNDNPPVFQEYVYSFDIPEDVQRGAQVGAVTATDADVGVNGELSYSVLSDWGNDVFSLNPQTGVFTLTSHLDYEQVQHYIFIVQAQDSGQPFLTSTVTVYFNVLDLNDNAPLFDPMSYNDEILENVTVGATVLQVSVTDLDSGDNGHVVYDIVEGDEGDHFHISNNGTIFTKKALDREVQSFYNLVVSATDQAWPPEKRLTSTVQVTVILKDVNDMAPEFVTPNETSVLENVPPNTVIMAVKAVDRDEGRNSYVEYSLAPQSDNKFTVGPIDGLLRVNGPLDREMKSKYAVTVVAKDRGHPSKMSSVEILVNIMDENDNSPVFDPKQYSGSVSENASIGLSILQVSSTDQDEGLSGQVRYSIIAGDANHDFAIGEDTGIIRVSKNLDYERKSRYVLTVQAEDGGNDIRLDTATVTISVADVNDNPPTFLDSPYEVHVMENAVATSPVSLLTVTGTDADSLPNNNIHYLIKDGDKSLFRINSSSGEIFLQRSLDREQRSEYPLTILAMDSGSPRQTGTGTVVVVVSDVNDNPPVFERSHSTVTVMENQAKGTEVITVTATDADAGRNGLLRYSLEGVEDDLFRVDPASGTVLTKTVLDREEGSMYKMLLVVRDSGLLMQHSATATLTILVGDENDNQPKFAESQYVVHIPEDALAGHFVLGTQAEDPDAGLNKRLVYHLSGMDADKFQINQDTGIIKLVQKLPEKKDGYHLEIFATDNGDPPLSSSTLVDVFLSSSKSFPTFRPGVRSFSFPESSENVYVTTVSASSPKTDIVRYSIADGSASSPFKIDPESGELRIVGGLDHETIPKYELWIEARDSDNPSLASAARIDIEIGDSNDNAPVFEREYYNASVGEEQSPPQLVLTVQATDADSNDNGKITYTFISPTNGQNPFKLDSKTGKIQTSAVLDREKIELYQLVVAAVDHGTPQKTGTATIFVTVMDKNDNPPRFTRLFSVNVTENAPVGTFVIQVTSSDRDIESNAKAVYSFTENPGSKFHIDPVSGNVTVASWIDREIKDEYLLKVAAVDGSWRAETPLTISVQDLNDNSPEFSTPVHTFNFPELQTAVAFVGRVSASDRDKPGPNSVISYTLKRPSDYFRIDPSSGEVMSKQSLRYRRTSRGFSPENQHILHVLATDHGKPPLSADTMVVINIVDSNNNAPVFQKGEYISPVPETANVGLSVLKLLAEDKEDVGVNAEIEYMITGGNGTEYFAVDSQTGWVSVTSNLPGHRGRYYALYVTASDKGIPPKSAEAKVTFVVTGENKHSPVFAALSYQVSIIENEPLFSEIATVSATDADAGGLNGQIVYSIISGNENETFAIGATTGIVTLVKPLDYESVKEYHLNVTSSDRGFHSKQTTAMLTVLVSDVNDNAPLFNSSSFDAYVAENQPIGTYVTRITATDADSKKNAIIQYSLVAGSGRDSFVIESETGVIKAKVKFDYEETNLHQVEVVAANPGSTQYSATKVTIHVTGKNEFYPKFVQQVFQFTVSESSPKGTTVGVLQATDEDSGREGEVFFLLVGSSNDKGFKVNPKTGVMTVSRNLDRESQARVVLTVMAKNYGSIRGNDTDEAQVVISIQDGNDPPVFSKELYEARVSEAAIPGTHVINVVATDKDVRPNNHQFLYSIVDDSKSVFTIDANSGSIQTAATLDRETIPYYNITVAAIDGGIPPQTGTAVVMVVLDDVNDNGPIFDPPEVTGYVMENEPPFTSVMVLSATDRDLPPNGAPFMYFLVGGEYKNYFEVDRHSGLVRTMQSLNREVTPSIVLTVEVHDSGVPQRKSRHPITIIVMDENDSPSSSRSLTVLVWMYNDVFPGGKVANVHPLDQDVTGQFQCSIVRGDSSVFQIPSKCDLHVYRIKNPRNYTITVKGNDGKHPNVTSTVQVNFASFENETMSNSVTLRILNQSAEAFLNNDFQQFQKTLSDIFKSVGFPVLYSITTVNDHIEMTLAIKTTRQTYIKPEEVLSLLQERKHVISKGKNVVIGYDPCDNVPCQNGATCQTYLDFQESLSIIDSSSLVFTSPTVSRQFRCECPGGYSGNLCQYQNDPCSPDPCLNKGVCQHDGLDFECACPPQYEGKRCENQREESCSSSPCKNGGTCEEAPDRSFFCLCRPGFRGTLCEMASDSCRPNRCQNGGTCVSKKPGYECACEANFFGRHCEKSTFGFKMYSYMAFPSLDPSTNDLSITFSTNKRNSLLFYNYGPQAGGRSDFVALELVDGRPKFSFGGSRTAIAIVRGDKVVSDNKWHKVTFIRNGRVASLTVADCSQFGEICEDCAHDNASCSYSIVGHTGSLNFAKNPFFVGGVPSVEALLERPGQIESDDFVGCIHSVSVNGRLLDLKNPAKSLGVTSTCGRKADVCSSTGSSSAVGANVIGGICGESATCKDLWYTYSCTCASGLAAPNCNEALEAFSLDGSNSFLELIPREKYNRIQLGSSSYHRWRRATSEPGDPRTKHLSFRFRTKSTNGIILSASTEEILSVIFLRDKKLHFGRGTKSALNNIQVLESPVSISDGEWHTFELRQGQERGSKVNITIDDRLSELAGESPGSVTDILDPYLTSLTLGGLHEPVLTDNKEVPSFQGCFQTITLNGEAQATNWSNSFFDVIPHGSATQRACSDDVLGLGLTQTDPLGIGVILVIVFFAILIVVILVSFIVFRKRKMRRDKPGHLKPGGAFLAGSSDPQRGHADTGYPDGSPEDILRSHMPQDLVPKKMKDREIERPQRPDIIEREVINKSPITAIPRMEEPPMPEPVKSSSSYGVHGLDSEPPEHYDLENASSIAPSDIDIVYHYKGFRDGNVRKYKANPHLPNFHKHNHRHSPHSFQASPIRESPRNILRQSPSTAVPRESPSVLKMQNTPLARLSPSSELSQQTPRILTLQDISGKPLQTALLATSQGVGPKELRDPMSNSERSLNSPVSNMSHSTSSMRSGPQTVGKKKEAAMSLGLTAEEIERLNSRPRNSSLVSTLDAVSSSSDDNTEKNKLAELLETNTELLEAPDSSTDESGNDSFTCSEFEYDNNYDKVHRDFGPGNMIFSKLAEEDNENDEDSAKNYDGFDSFRGSLSTLVASDDDLSNLSSYKPPNGSMLGWDYLLNWGPNFQNLVGVFKDIAELPDTMSAAASHVKPNEEYV